VAVDSSSALLFFGNGTPVMSIEIPKFAKGLPIPSRALDVWSGTYALPFGLQIAAIPLGSPLQLRVLELLGEVSCR